MDDLRSCVVSRDRYHIARGAGLVRKLLFDGANTLTHQVNRKHRLKIHFSAKGGVGRWPEDLPKPTFHISFISGRDWPWGPPQLLSMDQFLGLRICSLQQMQFSVRDMLDYAAYVLGGVHAGTPKDLTQEKLAELNRSVRIGQHPAIYDFVATAGDITHEGLSPLYLAVMRDAGRCPCESGLPFGDCHGRV